MLFQKWRHQLSIICGILMVVLFGVFVSDTIQIFHITIVSKEHVQLYLSKNPPICSEIATCPLKAGDILIRRHITEKTRLFEQITGAYFTHTAMYIGDDTIVEASGPEKDNALEVMARPYSTSDWATDTLESWVIARPIRHLDGLPNAIQSIERIADDPQFVFGVRWSDSDTSTSTSCADLIFRQYQASGVFADEHVPVNVSPDYLFHYIASHPEDISLIGFGIDSLPMKE